MPPSTRKRLFFAFFVLFIMIGLTASFYSLGWRVNFKAFSFQKIGAINIITDPKDVIIKIDGKVYSDQSGILQNGTVISNLLQKNYKIEIEKLGYLTYRKNVEVKPALVSKITKIRLIPEKIMATPIITAKGNKIIDLRDDKIIIQNEKNGSYYLYDLDNLSSVLNLTNLFENASGTSTIKKIAIVPFKPTNFIFEDKNGLKILDTDTGNATLAIKNPDTWTIENSSIYYIKTAAGKNKSPILYCYNLAIQTSCSSIEIPKPFSEHRFVKIKSINNRVAFSDSIGNLYFFDPNLKDIKKIAGGAIFFAFSPDNKKIAFIDNDRKINVQFLENVSDNTFKKSGDVSQFDLDNKLNIASISWYKDSNHIFINNDDNVKFMEIDDQYPLNLFPISNNAGNFRYEYQTNAFYYIINNKLQKIDFNSF